MEAQPWGHCFGIVLERKRLEFQIEKLLNFTDYSLLVFLCAGFQRNNKHRKPTNGMDLDENLKNELKNDCICFYFFSE